MKISHVTKENVDKLEKLFKLWSECVTVDEVENGLYVVEVSNSVPFKISLYGNVQTELHVMFIYLGEKVLALEAGEFSEFTF